ncbi:hypothetical protein ACA910_010194 [Epithemia clementina (nom. ined.)]
MNVSHPDQKAKPDDDDKDDDKDDENGGVTIHGSEKNHHNNHLFGNKATTAAPTKADKDDDDKNNESSFLQSSTTAAATTAMTMTSNSSSTKSTTTTNTNTNTTIRLELQQPQHEEYARQAHGIVLGETRCCFSSSSGGGSATSSSSTQPLHDFSTTYAVGTIVYVGPVASSSQYPKALYAGIVWDADSGRGKHDGSVLSAGTPPHEWVRHFYAPHGRASFVKLNKVLLEGRRVLTPDLLRQRYVAVHDHEWQTDLVTHTFGPHAAVQTTVPGRTKLIEFYGEAQLRWQQQVGLLSTLSLRRQGIATIDSQALQNWTVPIYKNNKKHQRKKKAITTTTKCNKAKSISTANEDKPPNSSDGDDDDDTNNKEDAPHGDSDKEEDEEEEDDNEPIQNVLATRQVQKLDLAGNLFSNWNVLSEILEAFPTVSDLNLSYNRIRDWKKNCTLDLKCHHSLLHLNVRGCEITKPITTLLYLGQACPNLQTLGLSNNPFDLWELDEANTDCLVGVGAENEPEEGEPQQNDDDKHTDDNNDSITTSNNSATRNPPCCLAHALPHLTRLDLAECQLSNQALRIALPLLASLPNLTSLNLDDNPFSQFPWATTTTTMAITPNQPLLFPSLTHLQLAGTQIASWSDFMGTTWRSDSTTVSSADNNVPLLLPIQLRFPQLSSLRLESTPLSQALGTATTRSQLIARFGGGRSTDSTANSSTGLQIINATPVTDRERQDAERRYVSSVSKYLMQTYGSTGLEEEKPGHTSQKNNSDKNHENNQDDEEEQQQQIQRQNQRDAYIAAEHPRFYYLAQKHQTAASAAQGGNHNRLYLADALISLTFQSMAAQSCQVPPLHRRVPVTLTIAQVHALLERQFGLDADLQELRVSFGGGGSGGGGQQSGMATTVLDDPTRDLVYFGVMDGSIVYMHEKEDEDTLSKPTTKPNGKKASSSLEQRMEQQEAELHDFLERQQKTTNYSSSMRTKL